MKKTATFLFIAIVVLNSGVHAAKTLYVVNGLSDSLSKIDLESGIVEEDIVGLGTWPNDILVSGERAYVVNSGSNDLYVIDLTSDSVLSVIDLGMGTNPWSLAMAGENALYVTNFQANSVSKLDLASGVVVAAIPVGAGPEGLLVRGKRLYVANTGWTGTGFEEGSVSVIDTDTDSLIATVPVGLNAQDLAMDPQGELAVVCTGDFASTFGVLYVIDSATLAVKDSIETGGTPARAVITDFGFLFMAAGGWGDAGEVYIHNTLRDTLLHGAADPLAAGPGVMDVAADREGYIYAASFSGNSVSVFDVPDEPVTIYEVGNGPTALALSEDPWIEVNASPESRVVRRGEDMSWSTSVENTGTEEEAARGMSFVVLPGGSPLPGNPVQGPYPLALSPGENVSASFSAIVPDAAPTGRYVFFSVAVDSDSRKKAIGSFWFHVLPPPLPSP